MTRAVSVQINLAPSDHVIAGILLERQVAFFARHVDEIVLTLDTRPNVGRYADAWATGKSAIEALIAGVVARHPKCRLDPVDYSPERQRAVADYFGQVGLFPLGDYRGAPCYVYFHGFHSCRNDLVFHIDGDMVLGGSLDGWFDQALAELDRPDILSVSPLPGPPTADGHIKQPSLTASPAARRYEFAGFSTRVFLLDRRMLQGIDFNRQVTGLLRLKSLLLPYKPIQASEVMIAQHMQAKGLRRVDFGGPGGAFSLHPDYKSARFLEALPAILARLDAHDIPDAQRGDFEFSDSYYDFSAERKARADGRWKRLLGLR
jgi:hypothetical protein